MIYRYIYIYILDRHNLKLPTLITIPTRFNKILFTLYFTIVFEQL